MSQTATGEGRWADVMGLSAPWQITACLEVFIPVQHPYAALVLLGCSGFEIRG